MKIASNLKFHVGVAYSCCYPKIKSLSFFVRSKDVLICHIFESSSQCCHFQFIADSQLLYNQVSIEFRVEFRFDHFFVWLNLYHLVVHVSSDFVIICCRLVITESLQLLYCHFSVDSRVICFSPIISYLLRSIFLFVSYCYGNQIIEIVVQSI